MTRKSKGLRSRTRGRISSKGRDKFKVEKFFKSFSQGDKVVVMLDASSQKGMPHSRFKGKIGTVKGKRGSSYVLTVKIGGKEKTVVSRPEHIKLLAAPKTPKAALKG